MPINKIRDDVSENRDTDKAGEILSQETKPANETRSMIA